jgi:hypothetical protein
MDPEVREAILVEELERILHRPDGQDLSAELDKAHTPPRPSDYRGRL